MNPFDDSVFREDSLYWEVVRVLATTIVILIVNIVFSFLNPYILLMIDLIIVSILDLIDSIPLKIKYKGSLGHRIYYQIYDKIGDMTLYLIVFLLHLLRVHKVGPFEIVFGSLYIYRLIGVILFISTRDSTYLILFPNFVCDNIILYLFLKYVLKLPTGIIIPLMIISIPLKILYEYIHHKVWKDTH